MNAAQEVKETEKEIIELTRKLISTKTTKRQTAIMKALQGQIERHDNAVMILTSWAKPRKAA